jgi:light-regulated signal transduction histidine kinase (bacteriophytochrome)
MGQLVDDLLAFSRVSRTPMTKSRVDLNRLVSEAKDEVLTGVNGHPVAWTLQPLPVVSGDRSLLRLVLLNLLANALKYSSTRERSSIEVGTTPGTAGETVVFVRDNGVGFDMRYVDKLFGVFQRLHRAEDFEGTGIGLANVRRIVQRHGGRTWAKGAVDGGATFYFSLPL